MRKISSWFISIIIAMTLLTIEVLTSISYVGLKVSGGKSLLYFHSSQSDPIGNAINDGQVEAEQSATLYLTATNLYTTSFPFALKYEGYGNKELNSTGTVNITLVGLTHSDNDTSTWTLRLEGLSAGQVTVVVVNMDSNDTADHTIDLSKAYLRFQVYHSKPLNVLSEVIGWIYFVVWSISFYPQVYLNWRRKSVIGLNFDFLALNFTGFLCYSAYNVGLYWIQAVLDEFKERNPHDIIPVELNDVIFALHALLLTIITLAQVFIYERGSQKVSVVARVILTACGGAVAILVIIAAVPSVKTFVWLDMLSGLSYVKLAITIIKYIPQAWMNFRRKSTVGWSIGNILLDFTGGFCSIIQMFILAYNFNDWKSIFLNPVKFWLGALSICFDILFMVQHYCLYKDTNAMIGGYDTLGDNNINAEAD